eukprot:58852-Chlamydomonas_euryale.AAC.1
MRWHTARIRSQRQAAVTAILAGIAPILAVAVAAAVLPIRAAAALVAAAALSVPSDTHRTKASIQGVSCAALDKSRPGWADRAYGATSLDGRTGVRCNILGWTDRAYGATSLDGRTG